MDIHQNARLTPHGREALARKVLIEGLTAKEAAVAFVVSTTTVRKWVRRYLQGGVGALQDRPSRPRHSPTQIPISTTAEIELLRRQRATGRQIAQQLGVSRATVHRVLCRRGLRLLSSIEPPEPPHRYEHAEAGALLHLDIKKLGRIGCVGHRIHGNRRHCTRGAGWEFLHVAIDDHSRLGFSQILPDERHLSAVAFLLAAVQYYQALGIRLQRVLTDNGSCYRAKAFRQACNQLGLRHRFTRPYRPRTNGKAERFIQTHLREWAYAAAYHSSAEREANLSTSLHHYNWHRPHSSLNRKPPISRLGWERNNVLRFHS